MAKRQSPRIQRVNNIALVLGFIFSVLAIANVLALFYVNKVSDEAHHHHYVCVDSANTLMAASDYLTSEVRMYVMTGNRDYAENYLHEVYVDRRRDKALETLSSDSKHHDSLNALTAAFNESSELAETELYAMRLMADVTNMEHVPSSVSAQMLTAEDAALSSEQKQQRAQELVLGNEYQKSKEAIIKNVSACTNDLIAELQVEEYDIDVQRTILLVTLALTVIMLVGLLTHVVLTNLKLVVRPLREHVKNIDDGAPLAESGSQEVRSMVKSYNAMYAENKRQTMALEHEAHTDALTGLLNRGSYDLALEQNKTDVALILMDVDNFKEINDTYGHVAGDEVLKRVAECIYEQFRTSDYACRVGGDEFAVIMTKMRGVGSTIVVHKLAMIAARLEDGATNIPATSLSVGVAFSEDLKEGEDIYKAADQALYQAKEKGRNCVCIYGK